MYEVQLGNRRVQREIEALQANLQRRVLDALHALTENPRPQGSLKIGVQIYRIRVGDFRIIYRINDDAQLIEIGGVLRRNEATYRRVEDLFA